MRVSYVFICLCVCTRAYPRSCVCTCAIMYACVRARVYIYAPASEVHINCKRKTRKRLECSVCSLHVNNHNNVWEGLITVLYDTTKDQHLQMTAKLYSRCLTGFQCLRLFNPLCHQPKWSRREDDFAQQVAADPRLVHLQQAVAP